MDNITGFNVTNKETGKRELRKYDFDSLGNKPKVNGEELTSEKELASKKQIDELKGDLVDLTQTKKSVNMYDASARTNGYALRTDTGREGEIYPNDNYDTSDYIEVSAEEEYKIGCYNGNILLTSGYTCRYLCFYDSEKHCLSFLDGNNLSKGRFTTPSNCNYVRFSISNTRGYHAELYDILSFADSFPAEFVPYFVRTEIKDSALSDTMQGLPNRVTMLEYPKPKVVVYWGDSLTAGDQDGTGVTRATVMQSLLGDEWIVKNFGAGGEQSNTIACRQGGMNLVVKPNQTINASGDSYLEIVDNEGNPVNMRSSANGTGYLPYESVNPCYIGGVKGILKAGSTFGASPWRFTRESSGADIAITRPTAIVTNAMLNYVGDIVIIEIGQNGGYDSDTDTLVRQIKQMIDINKSDKYIVCGFITANKTALNTALSNTFGRHFIDVLKYASTPIYDSDGVTIISSYGLDDMNLTMTETDLERINSGLMPKSLQVDADNIHLNQHGYTMQAYLEYKRGKELGYW